MNTLTIVVLAVCALVAVWLLATYNALARGRLAMREGWSGVDVQLQRRGNLIPNLVETVRGYAAHERQTLDSVTQARAALQGARTPAEAGEANGALTRALGQVFAVAEAYPDLKANQGFRDLQAQLADTEDKLAYARNYYNALVLQYNNRVVTVPSSFVAGLFGFSEGAFFQADDAAQGPVKVSF